MPRAERLDVPGALYHVIIRGIDGGAVFRSEGDYADFLRRLGLELKANNSSCYAWALMTNHVHLLVRCGGRRLSRLMQRLLTGYAVSFNLRYHRNGHLFQNRYKAILCEEEAYFLALVRYIHLNPFRAGLVRKVEELGRYPWSGEGALEGLGGYAWQDTDDVLEMFGKNGRNARAAYRAFVMAGAATDRQPELVGGGLIRSAGGIAEYLAGRTSGETMLGDVRVLGSSAFVANVLKKAEARERRTRRLARSMTPRQVIEAAAKAAGVPVAAMRGKNNHPSRVLAKDLACKWLVEDLGMHGAAVAKLLGISPATVSRGMVRGERIERERGFKIE